VGDDRSFTYAELAGRVRRLANGLRRLGVGRGDRVARLGPNHPAFLEALFASGLVGAADQLRVGGTGVNVLPIRFVVGTVVVPGDLGPAGSSRRWSAIA
jgi:acyl-coenzyme A synthetase/AMP-(fatty) acid ligase